MAKMTNIHKILMEIQQSQSFERLEPFKQPSIWNGLSREERVLLARLLVLQGAHQLAEGDHKVVESFDIASQISSYAPEILIQQGNILSSHRDNLRCLTLASHAFSRALQQDPSLFHGWVLHAQVLTDIGLFEGEPSYFIDACQNYERAFSLLNSTEPINKEDFYWKWGFCLASHGKLSGEPLDFHQAIEKYRLAYQLGCRNADFFNDYGHSLADLAALLENQDYFAEALKFFTLAVKANPRGFEGWFNQACCLQCLIEFSPQDHLLEQAEQSFEKAAGIDAQSSRLWFKWGQLDALTGKIKRDQKKLESCLAKFAKAHEMEPDHAQILNCWGEAILYSGAQDERLDLLEDAKSKILASLEIYPEDPNSWYLYGSCLNELGRYFSDEEVYHQAIEKFQYGLSLTRHHPLLWYGLALSNFALGELTEQQSLFEKAVRYCGRVIECGGGEFAQFWNDWGVALLKLAETTEQPAHVESAIEKFEKALKLPVENIEGQDVDLEWVYNYGSAFDLLGELTEEPAHCEKAVQILTQVLQLDPEYTHARYNLALALSHLGEATTDVELYKKSLEHFQILVENDPEDEMIHLDYGMSLTNLALLIYDVHHPEPSQALHRLAENHLMQAAVLGNSQAYYQLAGLYSITGHLDQAMHYLEKAQTFDALPGIDDLLHDEWLEGLRKIPAFRQFINELSSQQSSDDK